MGRPPHQFCWDNVDKLPNGKWRCKHCEEEFSGAASRIRNHLSGQGTDIGSCLKVPPQIQEEASKRGSKKRGRNSGEGNDGIRIPVANIGDLSINKGSEQQFTTSDAIVKFFLSRNIPLDAAKDPHFRTLLTTAAQHGFPSCLLRDDSVVIQRSLSNLEYEVNQYMVMVKESWRTTGCTVICYNLNQGRGNPSNSEKDSVVYGFYSPKGFIFTQGPLCKSFDHLADALKNHVLNLPIQDVKHHIYHWGHLGCEFAQELGDFYGHGNSRCCTQQLCQQLWNSICTKSRWVRNLIQKSEKLYDFMINSPRSYMCEGWREIVVEKDADATPRSAFTHLRSIIHLEEGIKVWLENNMFSFGYANATEIINNKEFWSGGKELVQVVTPLLQINDLVDTLVPTSGYIQLAVDKANNNLKPHYERDASKYQIIWDWLNRFTIMEKVDTYLSPIYDWRSIQGGHPPELIEDYLKNQTDKEEYEKLDEELKAYSYNNPFANLSSYERKCSNHPVTLWKEYGCDFPVLQKNAIKVLSQPTSCMCNQVKKHILQCQGSDNFILRLNYQMMQQFTKLGDRIYEPLGTQFLEGLNFTPPRSPLVPISPPMSAIPPSPKSVFFFELEDIFESLPKKTVDGPHIGQIPAWMNEFILDYVDVIVDGNCGYRAIAESFGLGQDKWREVRQQLLDELKSKSQLYEPTFIHGNVRTILKALSYSGSGFAPPVTWLEVTDMGLLVATTFKAKFVVMGSTICCTYLPLYLPEGSRFHNVPEIVVCLGSSHFCSLSLTDNAPLPPVSSMWLSNRRSSTQDFDRFLSNRCASYNKAATQYSERGKPSPIEIVS